MASLFNKSFFATPTTGLKARVILSLLIAILVTAIVYTSSFLEATGYSIWQLPIAFIYIFTLWQIEVLLSKKMDTRLPWSHSFTRRLFWEILLSFLASLVMLNIPYAIFKLYSIHYIETPGSSYNIYIFLLINSLGFIFYLLVTALHLGYRFIAQWQEVQAIAVKLKDENNQAKIMGYKQQLNPHFIFNNLNILTALIDKDKESAKIFVEQFATSYRYLLQGSEKELVTLRTEVLFIESYLYLLKVRFQNSLHFTLQIPDHLLDLYLPPFSLQLLIENSVKHNIVSQTKPLFIEVYTSGKEIIVRNNFQPKEQDTSGTQTGLKNIINRYHFFSDLDVKIEKTDTYFSDSLPLLETNEYINHRR